MSKFFTGGFEALRPSTQPPPNTTLAPFGEARPERNAWEGTVRIAFWRELIRTVLQPRIDRRSHSSPAAWPAE